MPVLVTLGNNPRSRQGGISISKQSKDERKSCYICAPLGSNLEAVRRVLDYLGVRSTASSELPIDNLTIDLKKQLMAVNVVIGILNEEHTSPWMWFELGQAVAFGRRVLLINSPNSRPLPVPLNGLPTLRIDVENSEAIAFALEQVLRAPSPRPVRSRRPKSKGLGTRADQLLLDLEHALRAQDFLAVNAVVASALSESGADTVVTSERVHKVEVDLAIWSDEIDPVVGNPLIIEVKPILTRNAFDQLSAYMSNAGLRWGMLLYDLRRGPEIAATRNHPHEPCGFEAS